MSKIKITAAYNNPDGVWEFAKYEYHSTSLDSISQDEYSIYRELIDRHITCWNDALDMGSSRPITISPYQERWLTDFQMLAGWYTEEFGDLIIEIHHVGSTSVPGLVAKPRIDIDIEINPVDFDAVRNHLESIGYIFRGDLDIPGRFAFSYRGERDLVAHNLYVCPSGSQELKRHLAFRNYLRSHPEEREKYSQIKLDAIQQGKSTIDVYMDHKGEVVVEILDRALRWADAIPELPEEYLICPSCSGEEINTGFEIRYIGGGDKAEYFILDCMTCQHHWEVQIS